MSPGAYDTATASISFFLYPSRLDGALGENGYCLYMAARCYLRHDPAVNGMGEA